MMGRDSTASSWPSGCQSKDNHVGVSPSIFRPISAAADHLDHLESVQEICRRLTCGGAAAHWRVIPRRPSFAGEYRPSTHERLIRPNQ